MDDAQKAAWLSQRCGKLTASRMADALDVLKSGKPSAARTRLMHEILAERLMGDSVPHFVNDLMRWGLEQEPHAKDAFEVATGSLLVPCGFVDHPSIDNFGATPDALLDGDALVEFKCPQTVTHIAWKLARVVPEQHRPQILAQLACTGRTRAVFVSFDPRVPERQRLFMREWAPDRAEVEEVEEGARAFLAEVDAMWEALTCN
ncbi:MAG: YqaJ viral recombinase family protein [Leptolyngbyaceae bacterium]|nr:YqaJ viral recombinase family protein [Leptolyngbyaceae bacterium]